MLWPAISSKKISLWRTNMQETISKLQKIITESNPSLKSKLIESFFVNICECWYKMKIPKRVFIDADVGILTILMKTRTLFMNQVWIFSSLCYVQIFIFLIHLYISLFVLYYHIISCCFYILFLSTWALWFLGVNAAYIFSQLVSANERIPRITLWPVVHSWTASTWNLPNETIFLNVNKPINVLYI